MSKDAAVKISVSRIRTWLECPYKHHVTYTLGWRPTAVPSEAMAFGLAWHSAVERWWLTGEARVPSGEPHQTAALRRTLTRYVERRQEERGARIAELPFEAELEGMAFVGRIDLLLQRGGRWWVVEHKTTSEDVTPGAIWWQTLGLDYQPAIYMLAARAMGHDPAGMIYDVLGKPGIRPRRGESVDDYGARFAAAATLATREVCVGGDRLQAALDNVGEIVDNLSCRAQNPAACFRFGRCSMVDHCHYGADLGPPQFTRGEERCLKK
mgnify:CR=1 FL=1